MASKLELFTQQLDQCYNILTQQMVIINTMKDILDNEHTNYTTATATRSTSGSDYVFDFGILLYDSSKPIEFVFKNASGATIYAISTICSGKYTDIAVDYNENVGRISSLLDTWGVTSFDLSNTGNETDVVIPTSKGVITMEVNYYETSKANVPFGVNYAL